MQFPRRFDLIRVGNYCGNVHDVLFPSGIFGEAISQSKRLSFAECPCVPIQTLDDQHSI